jgi:hypothetical protein
MKFQVNDGGRAAAGFKSSKRDCVCRAIAIATDMPYEIVHERLNQLATYERRGKRKRGISSAASGVYKPTIKRYMQTFTNWTWVSTMGIGTGTTVHLREGELPFGRLLVSVSLHQVAVIDGVIHDVANPARGGTRAVYGYWKEPL